MFDGIVERYDLVNDMLSLGLVRSWRRTAVRAASVRQADLVLDLGTGTGRLAGYLPAGARPIGVDLSERMLLEARSRLPVVQGSALRLPFRKEAFDRVISAFVLRSLPDLGSAFAELARVVRRGGSISLLDITAPLNRLLRIGFHGYFGTAAPLLGRVVGRAEAYRALARSVGSLPARDEVCAMLQASGFERCRARGLSGGVVTVWSGSRN
jgi:demethylmenaquinone methyltransferase/2-methoxy-6-polyprenyl-1,4-benzoquinol methylase